MIFSYLFFTSLTHSLTILFTLIQRYTGGLSVFTFLRIRTWMNITDQTSAEHMVEDCGFTRLKSKHCMYIQRYGNTGEFLLVCAYVDDLIIAYSHRRLFDKFINTLEKTFINTQCRP